ncbi:MAG: PfkB family carbohydrate kinase [Saprospiraceae bacterium]
MTIDYLCIGHVCQDIVPEGFSLGGTVSYCSITAQLLGKKPGILTSFSDDFSFLSSFQEIAIHNKKTAHTTVFENIYHPTHRTQYIFKRADDITIKDLPAEWKNVQLVQLGPIADEVDFSLIKAFHPDTIIAATPQGWLRQWDEATREISPKVFDWNKLKGIDILILSDEDISGYESLFPSIVEQIPIVVMTRGNKAATVFKGGQQQDFPTYPTKVVDPTGAGDTFATGFLVKYLSTKNIRQAMSYGHVVASFCIESKGLKGLKNLDKVEKRYQNYLNSLPF